MQLTESERDWLAGWLPGAVDDAKENHARFNRYETSTGVTVVVFRRPDGALRVIDAKRDLLTNVAVRSLTLNSSGVTNAEKRFTTLDDEIRDLIKRLPAQIITRFF